MAKKSRKPNLPEETLQRARQELYGDAQPAAEPAAKLTTAPPAAPRPGLAPAKRREVNLRVEYAYVITDLKNMAMLAAALMVVLIALSFFI